MSHKKNHTQEKVGALEGEIEQVSEQVSRRFWSGFFEFIKFSHTLFALPFAFTGVALAVIQSSRSGAPQFEAGFWWNRIFLVLAAMVLARTAAMTFNRLVDWNIDKRNPRTAHRHKLLSRKAAMIVWILSSLGFVFVCYWINWMALQLSGLALATIFIYSVMKRFTHFSHFFLGFALALAPLGAWVAVMGDLNSWTPWILALAVVFWVAGFDLIYALQDIEFDRREELYSLAAHLGPINTLVLSRVLHFCMIGLLLGLGMVAELGGVYFSSMVLITGVLIWEHRMAMKNSPEAIQIAFFRANALISFILMLSVFIESLRS